LDRPRTWRSTASIVGREFSFELIEAVSGISPDTLREGLDRLVHPTCSSSAARRRERATSSSTR
jgi:hypothetical protein